MYLHKVIVLILGVYLSTWLVSCTDPEKNNASLANIKSVEQEQFIVYKSPTCGCCEGWIEHLQTDGFETEIKHPQDLNLIKDRYQIDRNLRSCHTAVSKDGFVFEGHVPNRYIREFLDNPPPGAFGLSVPGMPLGSPGMEVGNQFTPYQIVLLKKDGAHEVFASIERADQQY